jgi:hypothetical protein
MRKNSPSIMLLICVSLLVSLFAVIPLNDRARAQSNHQPQQLGKLSPDLVERTRGTLSGGQRIKAILQLNENPRGQLNALLNRNGVHAISRIPQGLLPCVNCPAVADSMEEISPLP